MSAKNGLQPTFCFSIQASDWSIYKVLTSDWLVVISADATPWYQNEGAPGVTQGRVIVARGLQ